MVVFTIHTWINKISCILRPGKHFRCGRVLYVALITRISRRLISIPASPNGWLKVNLVSREKGKGQEGIVETVLPCSLPDILDNLTIEIFLALHWHESQLDNDQSVPLQQGRAEFGWGKVLIRKAAVVLKPEAWSLNPKSRKFRRV